MAWRSTRILHILANLQLPGRRGMMKYTIGSFLGMLAVCSTSVDAGEFYLGASTGIMDASFDEAVNAGILAGS